MTEVCASYFPSISEAPIYLITLLAPYLFLLYTREEEQPSWIAQGKHTAGPSAL